MAFYLAESNLDGTKNNATERQLLPAPTRPEYGERFNYTMQGTDGTGVRQKHKKQSRELKWIWENYRDRVPRYEALYWDLFNQQAHLRKKAGESPYVWLKEDVTRHFGKYSTGTSKVEPEWIRVLITYVGRTDPSQGGYAIYPTTELRFVIADDTIQDVD